MDPLNEAQMALNDHRARCEVCRRDELNRVSISSYDSAHAPQVGRLMTDEPQRCPEGQRLWDALMEIERARPEGPGS
jgi:hypothetical protein